MASKRVTDAFSKEMCKFGYSSIDVLDIGTDPFTRGEHYIVVGKSDAVGNYATWSGVDWAHHPNAADRKRGVTLNSGRYGFKTKTEAMEDANDIMLDLLNRGGASYTAFITGPSRTADIERIGAVGVHGPLELHIVLLEDAHV